MMKEGRTQKYRHKKESADNNDSRNNNKVKLLRIINDRKVLEFLSHNGRKVMRRNDVQALSRC